MRRFSAEDVMNNRGIIHNEDGFLYIYVDRNGDFCPNVHGAAFMGATYWYGGSKDSFKKACKEIAIDLNRGASNFERHERELKKEMEEELERRREERTIYGLAKRVMDSPEANRGGVIENERHYLEMVGLGKYDDDGEWIEEAEDVSEFYTAMATLWKLQNKYSI